MPVAGSAYTFSYATFGEFIAWIIGWDLMLEFAVGAAVVAKGWSSYLGTVFGFGGGTVASRPARPRLGRAADRRGRHRRCWRWAPSCRRRSAVVITAIKVAVVLLVVVVGAFYIKAANYSPFIPPAEAGHGGDRHRPVVVLAADRRATGSHYGWYGVLAGASIVFFAFIGFDIVATTAEETKNPQRDVPRGILGSLAIVTVLYVAVAVVLSGMVRYTELRDGRARRRNLATAFAANGVDWAAKVISIGALAGLTTVVMVLMLGQTRVLFAMCARRAAAAPAGQDRAARHAGADHHARRRAGGHHGVGVPDRQARGDGQRRHAVRVRAGFGRGDRAAPHPSRPANAASGRRGCRCCRSPSIVACVWLMLNLTGLTWIRFVDLDGHRRGDLLRLRPQAFGAGPPGACELRRANGR